ncbi:MAG: DUF4160 domain-containing protein [Magnetospirillum sp.]|nr:DUF4160 domain-containing protein [Magnetospirillum sp.]
MPVVFRWQGVRFFFFSNEGNPREPLHIHADRDGAEAKIWLVPDVRVAASVGFSRKELTELVAVVDSRKDTIERAWHEHFG